MARFKIREAFVLVSLTGITLNITIPQIALLTPYTVHYGLAAEVTRIRQRTLDLAYESHPERFVKKAPKAPVLPGAVWINPPSGNRIVEEDMAMRFVDGKMISMEVIAH